MMKKTGALSVFVTAMLAAMLFVGAPSTAFAASTVDILGAPDVATIQADIQDAIDAEALAGGGEVTVIGEFYTADANLNLEIPQGVTLIWKAVYYGNAARLIDLGDNGTATAGTFAVQDYRIENGEALGITVYSTNTTILVSGGAVAATGVSGIAIRNESALTQVTGGMVGSSGIGTMGDESVGIASISGNIAVSGSGRVVASGDRGIAIRNTTGNVYVGTGGTVSTSAENCVAIRMYDSGLLAPGAIAIDGGTIETTGDGSEGIYSEANTIAIASGSIMVGGSSSRGINTHMGNVYIEDVDIEVTKGGSIGIYTNSGLVGMIGGSFSITGDGSTAIQTNTADVYLIDVTLACTGDYATGVEIYYGFLATDGATTITAGGANSVAVQVAGNGSAIIQGGPASVSTTGIDSFALRISELGSGVIAYLAGTVSGAIEVASSGSDASFGVIIEVDSLEISAERNGTKDGLAIKAIGVDTETGADFDYYWDTENYSDPSENLLAVIKVVSVSPEQDYDLLWADVFVPAGGDDGDDEDALGTTVTPRTGDSLLVLAMVALLCAAMSGGSLFAWSRRKESICIR